MTYTNPEALVTTARLNDHLGDASLRVLDGSWHMPALNRDPRAEFAAAHIPGAVYFDIDDIADDANPLPHMIPSAEKFAERVGKLGISNDHRVIVYDTTGVGSAARVWWMFRLFGHDNVAVMDGGLPKWLAEGRPTESGDSAAAAATFVADKREPLVRTVDQLLANIQTQADQVLDARTAGRFDATEPEPRAGLRGGHIPGSFNQPFLALYEPETKTLKSAEALTALFDAAGVDRGNPIVTSCGSGVTACNLALGLYLIGKTDVAIYDGSWTEWGGRQDTPIDP